MDREVPLSDAAVLRTLCGLKESDDLPEKLITKYWEMKRICLRDNVGMTRAELHMVCFSTGHGKVLEREANPTLVDLYRAGKLKRESPVIVRWGKGERQGILKRIDSQDRLVVLMNDETVAQPFAADKVRLAEMAAA